MMFDIEYNTRFSILDEYTVDDLDHLAACGYPTPVSGDDIAKTVNGL